MKFTPAIEDCDALGTNPLLAGHEHSSAAATAGAMEDEEKVVVAALTRARKRYVLSGDAATAYQQLRPLLHLHTGGGGGLRFHRRELEDTAVELLLALEDGKELEAWVCAAPEATGPRHRSHKESLFSLDATAKEFSAFNSAELGQRVAVFRVLAKQQRVPSPPPPRQLCASSTVNDNGVGAVRGPCYESRCRLMASVVECMTALTRKQHRRDIFLWKHLARVLMCVDRECAADGTAHLSDSEAVVQELSAYVSDVIVRCLEYRDRPLESAARAYGTHRAAFEESFVAGMPHRSPHVQRIWTRWLEAIARQPPPRPLPLPADVGVSSTILGAAAVLQAKGCEENTFPLMFTHPNLASIGSRPSTPRNMEAHVGVDVSTGASQQQHQHAPLAAEEGDGRRLVLPGASASAVTCEGLMPNEFARCVTMHVLQWLGVDGLLLPPASMRDSSTSESVHGGAQGVTSAEAEEGAVASSPPLIDALVKRITPHHQPLLSMLQLRLGSNGEAEQQPVGASTDPSHHPQQEELLPLYLTTYSFVFTIFTSTPIAALFGQQHAAYA